MYNSKGVFPFIDKYITQIFNSFADRPLTEAQGLLPLGITVSGKFEKSVGHNQPLSLIKKDVSFIIG